jgi:hypothetical protein
MTKADLAIKINTYSCIVAKSSLLIPLVFVCFLISGCISNRPFPVHGNFCGPHYPDLKSANIQDEVSQLENIPAFDKIDAACKRHDICYAEAEGYMNSKIVQCDQILLDELDITHRFRIPTIAKCFRFWCSRKL